MRACVVGFAVAGVAVVVMFGPLWCEVVGTFLGVFAAQWLAFQVGIHWKEFF